ncbi:hypothetical protein MIR68_004257 [Amoeboaphelidium protococcarum]|nr:hypothetical protein MIR68_004257 [Amoeboaphelidium protococcarum]
MNNLGGGLQSKQQMRSVSASTYSTPQLANVAESPHDLMSLKQKQSAMMKEINYKLHATQRYDTTMPLCNDGIIINQNVTLHNGLTIPAGTMFTQMVPPSSQQQQQQQQQQYQQLGLNIGNSNSAAFPDFYSLPSGNGLTLGDTDCSWLGGSSVQLQNRPDYNQNHSRKRTISSITSNNDYNTLLLDGGGSCSGAGEADLDSLIMQPQELDSIDNFFQQALHNQSQLFNQSEQEYFSNFLDGILVGDDEDDDNDNNNNNNGQGATGDTYDPSKKILQKSNVSNSQKLNDSAMFSAGLKQTVDIRDNPQESSDVVGFESALPQSSSFADINAIKLMNTSALPSVSSDINRYVPQSLFQQAPPQRYSVFQPSGSLLPNSRFQQHQLSSSQQQQHKLDKEEPDKGQVDANGPKVVLAPRKKRHASSQLLTEQEKRQNHVLSEQKRRQNIKLGFEAICQLVPSLKLLHGTDAQRSQHNRQGPPPAKTVILGEAIEFLNQLLAENQLLEERALELGRILQLRNIQQTTRHS